MDTTELGKLQIFANFSPEEIETTLGFMEPMSFSAGEVIFRKNDPGGTLFVVTQGEVQINAVIAHDLKKSLVHVPPGAVFGELSLFTRELRSADAVALEESTLLALETGAFEQFLADHPGSGSKLLIYLTTIISDRLRNTTDMYRQSLEWSLSVSGAIELHMDQLITGNVTLSVKLVNGDLMKGRLLKVDQHAAGHVLFMQSEAGKLEIIPYPAVVAMSFDKNALDLKPHADLL